MQDRSSAVAITSRSIAILLAIALVTVLTIAGTRAAFIDTTSNTGNSFASADISLTDDASATVMFTVADMLPGDTLTHCIGVTYDGPDGRASQGVEVYVPSYDASSGANLISDLKITIEEGTTSGPGFDPAGTRTGVGDVAGDCSGFTVTPTVVVNALPLDDSTFPTQWGECTSCTWTPGAGTNPETLTYRISVELDSASTAEGESVTAIPFTWETRVGS